MKNRSRAIHSRFPTKKSGELRCCPSRSNSDLTNSDVLIDQNKILIKSKKIAIKFLKMPKPLIDNPDSNGPDFSSGEMDSGNCHSK